MDLFVRLVFVITIKLFKVTAVAMCTELSKVKAAAVAMFTELSNVIYNKVYRNKGKLMVTQIVDGVNINRAEG